ncbi:MAG: polysaccharide pyruvyl transferase family protein [Clostridiaceae bacterium]|nr:polysaccharide pyruvyl transferase family protein [Clostridiaceae bacterium]
MIGLINLQWFDNPGAVWLAYSLQQTIKKLEPNKKVVIIDYADGGAKTVNTVFIKKILNYIRRRAESAFFYIKSDNRSFRRKLQKRHNKYEEFRKYYLSRTSRTTELDSEVFNMNFSACVVGSDVVWKPQIAEGIHSKVYFLQFAGNKTIKIAYAASIGTDDPCVLDSLKDLYKNLISDFNSISLRERTAVHYIEQLTDKKVYHVLDPVFLLEADSYISLLKNIQSPCQQKYIYMYMLTYNENIVSLAIQLAKKNNYKIVYDLQTRENTVLRKRLKKYGIPSIDAGPLDFLALINSASVVLCDSFHGTAFSIILHKDFYTFGCYNSGIDISTRMKDLLEMLSLEERYVTNNNFICGKPIDYREVEKQLSIHRKESIKFLKNALDAVL